MSDFGNHRVRGCEPRPTAGRGSPRGRISLSRQPVKIGGAIITGLKLRILCEVKLYLSGDKQAFAEFCRTEGIAAYRIGSKGSNVYECIGTEESLLNLAYSSFIRRWEFAVSTASSKNVVDKDRERAKAGRARSVKANPIAKPTENNLFGGCPNVHYRK